MKVSECMTRDVKTIAPDRSVQEAARLMAELDLGVLPVGEGDRLVGMITDRDIVVRAVGEGKGPQTAIREVMTEDIKYCFEDQDIDEVAHNMGDKQVRRLPVRNRNQQLVGIISLGDFASGEADRETLGKALEGISRKGGARSQSSDSRH